MNVRTRAEDAHEQKLLDDIAQYGWHCVGILSEDEDGPYSFSVGLFQTFGHPELVIFGLTSEVAHQILSIAVTAIRSGQPLDLTQPTDALLEGYACRFVDVPKSEYYEHLGFARWYYRGDSFPACQVVYPSRGGHFPWDPEAPQTFKKFQPVLGQSASRP